MDYWFYGLVRLLCILLLFSRVVVLLSTMLSYLGIPSSFKRGLLKELVLNFSTFMLDSKHPPSTTTLFLQQYNVVLQGIVVRVHNTTSCTHFSKEGVSIPLGDQWGSPWSIFQILALGQPIFFHLQRSIPQWLRYFQWAFAVRVLQIVWRVKS